MESTAIQQKNYARKIIAITSIAALSYAILRYHIAGNVPWKDFPLLILNKGISLAAFILLTFNFSIGPLKNLGIKVSEGWINARQVLGMTAFLYVLIHALISFMIFKPEVFGKFFEENGSFTLYAGLSMLGGILSFVVLWAYNLAFKTTLKEDKMFIQFITSRKFLLIAMLLSLVHLFFMGINGWMNPADWNRGLPPISLIAFTFFIIGYIINLFGRK
jgi:DMSO/TMAO reductase YedYZ heme-binding membrane subunit